jgi:hypothetical protein
MAGKVCALGIALALAVGVLVPTHATAAEDAPAAVETPSKWEFEFLPYMWLLGSFGSATVKGTKVQVDAPFSDLWDLMTGGNAFGGMGYISLAYDRFSFFTDDVGGYANVSVNQTIPTQLCNVTIRAVDKARFVISDFAFGYRLGEWPLPGLKRPFTLGVYAGTRYMHLASKLSATAGVVGGLQKSANVEDTFNWADPMIGVRWSLPVLDSLTVDLRSDIGGFHASSDLIWGLSGAVKYWLPWKPMDVDLYLNAGYRVISFDRGSSSDNVDLQMRGPTVGLGFVF